MVIRRATPEDVPAIIDLAVEMVVHSTSPHRDVPPERVREYRREDLQTLVEAVSLEHARIFVAEEGGQVVGHVVVVAGHRDSSTGEGQGWVFDLSIRADCWGRGLGKILMEHAEEFIRARGFDAIGLGVTISNQRALRFYREIGYQEERIQMVKKLTPVHGDCNANPGAA